MSKASREEKEDYKNCNRQACKGDPYQYRRGIMTLKTYKQQCRRLERTQRKEKRYRNNLLSLSEVLLNIRRERNENKWEVMPFGLECDFDGFLVRPSSSCNSRDKAIFLALLEYYEECRDSLSKEKESIMSLIAEKKAGEEVEVIYLSPVIDGETRVYFEEEDKPQNVTPVYYVPADAVNTLYDMFLMQSLKTREIKNICEE